MSDFERLHNFFKDKSKNCINSTANFDVYIEEQVLQFQLSNATRWKHMLAHILSKFSYFEHNGTEYNIHGKPNHNIIIKHQNPITGKVVHSQYHVSEELYDALLLMFESLCVNYHIPFLHHAQYMHGEHGF